MNLPWEQRAGLPQWQPDEFPEQPHHCRFYYYDSMPWADGYIPKAKHGLGKGDARKKLAFSTSACPDWTWEDILEYARKMGFAGIEVDGLQRTLRAVASPPFLPENRLATRRQLRQAGVQAICLNTVCALWQAKETALDAAMQTIDLAGELQIPFVKIAYQRGAGATASKQEDLERARRNADALAQRCLRRGVHLLIETQGTFANSRRLADFLHALERPEVGVLWDVQGPFWRGEAAQETLDNLAEHIRLVHWKDAQILDGRLRYRAMGEGDLPLPSFMNALQSIGYSGYHCLEWPRRWHPELETLEAIAPGFIEFMRRH